MKIEKICEYFNDIGILQLEDIDTFLKIYTQLSQNKYKNKSDKLILALFSYITLVSKNEQQLYDICRNIVNCFSNKLILYRYKALTMFNNIFKNKLHSKYIFFLSKLNSFTFNKKRKTNNYIRINPNIKKNYSNHKKDLNTYDMENEEDNENTNNNLIEKNNIRINSKPKRDIIRNNKRKNYDNYKELHNISDDNKECTFSPKINHNYKPKYKIKYNNPNYNSDFLSSLNYSNDNNDISSNNKFVSFKNSKNYGYNDKINIEIEKMLSNMSKYSNNPNNSKYLPIKTIYRKQINNIYPYSSYNELPSFQNINYGNYNNYNDITDNNAEYHYYDEDYDFYENENEHVKKVQDKILQLKLQKLENMSKECTFSPKINQVPKYLNPNNINERNYLTEYNLSHRNHRNFKNDNNNNNNIINNSINMSDNRNFSKNKKNKINEEYADDYYNIYPKQLNQKNKKRPRSYSASKNNNEYSVYKARKEELSKLFKEQYPFVPTVNYNKNIQIKSTFEERQKKFLDDKKNIYKQKEEEEKKQIEEKKKNRSKTDSKEVVKRLYDKEAIKIKERLKKEKEEKNKKKNVIDWSNKRKNKKFVKNKNNFNVSTDKKEKEENIIDFKSFSNNTNKEKRNIKNNLNNIDSDDYNNNDKNEKEGNNIIDFSTFSKDKKVEKKEKNKENEKKDKSVDNKTKKNKSNKNMINKEKIKDKNNEINQNQKMLMDKIKDEHVIGFKNNISNNNSNYDQMENNSIHSLNDEDYEKNKEKENVKENNNGNNDFIDYKSSLSLNLEEKMKNFEKNNNILNNMNNKGGIKSTAFQEIMNKQHNK